MDKSLGAYIMHFKQVIPPHVCQNIVEDLKKNLWHKHAYNNPKTGETTTYDDDLEIAYDGSEVSKFIMSKIDGCINEYIINYMFPWFTSITGRTEVRFNKYEVGTRMRQHIDNITTIFDGTRRGSPTLTILGMLNEDYEGGEFILMDDLVIPFKTGDIVIFPSNFLYPHEVLPVTKGTRYSYVSWTW